MLTKKENMRNFYLRKSCEYYPNYMDAIQILWPPQGFRERPKDDLAGKDWFGIDWVYEEAGGAPVPDHTVPPILSEVSEWREKVKFPDLDAWDWEAHVKEDHPDEVDRENKLYSVWLPCGPFERMHDFLGFENSLVSMLTEPEECEKFLDAIMEHKCKMIEKIAKHYKPDIIQLHDDWGTQINLFFSPDIWRRLIKPQIKKAVDTCHEQGIIYEQHTCGKVDSIVPELADIGVDCAFIMGINDITGCKRITGDSLAYCVQPKGQEYSAEYYTNQLDEAGIRTAVRAELINNCKGGHFSTFAMPSGSKTSKGSIVEDIIFDEVIKSQDELTKLISVS